jgi:regulator of replication initiation timing
MLRLIKKSVYVIYEWPLRQLEGNQTARDKIFKERIQSLEHQTNLLKDQLSKEMRRRQTLITESSSINNEISELRQNLDQSLFVVNEQTDGRTLDREASRLNLSVDKFGPDYISRLTPSKLGPALKSSTPKYHRRNL